MSGLKDLVTGGGNCNPNDNALSQLLPQIHGSSALRENNFAGPSTSRQAEQVL
jgi:hypothetical protein